MWGSTRPDMMGSGFSPLSSIPGASVEQMLNRAEMDTATYIMLNVPSVVATMNAFKMLAFSKAPEFEIPGATLSEHVQEIIGPYYLELQRSIYTWIKGYGVAPWYKKKIPISTGALVKRMALFVQAANKWAPLRARGSEFGNGGGVAENDERTAGLDALLKMAVSEDQEFEGIDYMMVPEVPPLGSGSISTYPDTTHTQRYNWRWTGPSAMVDQQHMGQPDPDMQWVVSNAPLPNGHLTSAIRSLFSDVHTEIALREVMVRGHSSAMFPKLIIETSELEKQSLGYGYHKEVMEAGIGSQVPNEAAIKYATDVESSIRRKRYDAIRDMTQEAITDSVGTSGADGNGGGSGRGVGATAASDTTWKSMAQRFYLPPGTKHTKSERPVLLGPEQYVTFESYFDSKVGAIMDFPLELLSGQVSRGHVTNMQSVLRTATERTKTVRDLFASMTAKIFFQCNQSLFSNSIHKDTMDALALVPRMESWMASDIVNIIMKQYEVTVKMSFLSFTDQALLEQLWRTDVITHQKYAELCANMYTIQSAYEEEEAGETKKVTASTLEVPSRERNALIKTGTLVMDEGDDDDGPPKKKKPTPSKERADSANRMPKERAAPGSSQVDKALSRDSGSSGSTTKRDREKKKKKDDDKEGGDKKKDEGESKKKKDDDKEGESKKKKDDDDEGVKKGKEDDDDKEGGDKKKKKKKDDGKEDDDDKEGGDKKKKKKDDDKEDSDAKKKKEDDEDGGDKKKKTKKSKKQQPEKEEEGGKK